MICPGVLTVRCCIAVSVYICDRTSGMVWNARLASLSRLVQPQTSRMNSIQRDIWWMNLTNNSTRVLSVHWYGQWLGQGLTLLLLLLNFPSLSWSPLESIWLLLKEWSAISSLQRIVMYDTGASLELYCYCDAYWEWQDDSKSVSGYLFKVNSGIVSRSFKKQTETAFCTAEAEYIAFS